jgi:hypothetical protein
MRIMVHLIILDIIELVSVFIRHTLKHFSWLSIPPFVDEAHLFDVLLSSSVDTLKPGNNQHCLML